MPIKVLDAEGNQLEVSGDEAQAGYAAGRYKFADDKIRVVSSDNKTGHVQRDQLSTALSQGWTVATDEQAEAKQLRREESGLVGTVRGGGEAIIRGASVGLSTPFLVGLGADRKRMKARKEALGAGGTALEVGGAVASALLTGGGTGAAQAGVRGGGSVAARLAAGTARTAGRLVSAPTKLAGRAGSAVERALLGAEAGVGRKVFARSAGEALDGALGGLGGAVSESVLDDKDLTAEALVGGALAGGAFGAGVGAATGLGSQALGRVLGGLHPKTGAKVGDADMAKVLGRDVGSVDVPDPLVSAARKTDDSALGSFAERAAPLSGADPAIAKRVFSEIQANPKRARDLLNRRKEIEEDVASTFQDGIKQVRDSLDDFRKVSGGEAKYGSLDGKLPKNADFVSPRITEKLRKSIEGRITGMEEVNTKTFARSFDPGALREVKALTGRAFEEAIEGGAPLKGRPAASSFRSMDRLKRDLGEKIRQTGGWGAPRPGVTTDVVAGNKAMREIYDEVKTHLEREDLWGGAALAQREINESYSKLAQVQADFKAGATGTGLRAMFNPDGTISMRQAMTLARQYSKMGGAEVVDKFDEALEAQVHHLRTVAKHYDLGADGAKQVKAAEEAVATIRKRFSAQADNARFLDDMESLRQAESNRSASLGVMSTVGPTVGAALGGAIAGPIGAAAGVVVGGVLRPYSTARSMASLMAMTGDFGKKFAGESILLKLKARWAPKGIGAKVRKVLGVGDGAARAGRGGVRAAAFQIGKGTIEERADKVDRIRERVTAMSSPESIKRAMGPELEALAESAPETAAAIEGVAQRAAQYLKENAPTIRRNAFTGRPGHVNPRKIDKWLRKRGAVVDPEGVIDRLVDGTVTRDEIDALKVVYPRHHQMMVQGVTEAVALAAQDEPIGREGRVLMSRLLEVPLDDSLKPNRIASVQSLYGSPTEDTPEQAAPEQSGTVRATAADDMDPSKFATNSQSVA